MNRFLYSSRSALVAFGLISALVEEANAQVAVVAFSPVSGLGVPISPWLVGLTATVLAVLAYGVFRCGMSRASRLFVAMAASAAALGMSMNGFPTADAADAPYITSFELTWPSPTTSPPLIWFGDTAVVNATGQDIKIDSVTITGYGFYLESPTSLPVCGTGLALAPGAVCYISVATDFSS